MVIVTSGRLVDYFRSFSIFSIKKIRFLVSSFGVLIFLFGKCVCYRLCSRELRSAIRIV